MTGDHGGRYEPDLPINLLQDVERRRNQRQTARVCAKSLRGGRAYNLDDGVRHGVSFPPPMQWTWAGAGFSLVQVIDKNHLLTPATEAYIRPAHFVRCSGLGWYVDDT